MFVWKNLEITFQSKDSNNDMITKSVVEFIVLKHIINKDEKLKDELDCFEIRFHQGDVNQINIKLGTKDDCESQDKPEKDNHQIDRAELESQKYKFIIKKVKANSATAKGSGNFHCIFENCEKVFPKN